MNEHFSPLDARTLARILGGEAYGNRVVAPGPGHSPEDRSLSVLVDHSAPDGFVVNSFAGNDWRVARDYVNEKRGLPAWSPTPKETGEDIIRRLSAKATKAVARLDLNKAKPQANGHEQPRGEAPKPFYDGHLTRDGFEHVVTYDYTVDGEPLYQVLRYEHPTREKKFLARRPDGNGGWLANAGDRRVLYRVDDMKKVAHDNAFYVTEGEKDADRLASLGFVAVTVAFGAWSEEAIRSLEGREVYILEDNDEPGRKKSKAAANALHGVARAIRIVQLPGLKEKQDVSDWLDAGNDPDTLVDICKAAPLWKPEADETAKEEGLPFVGFDDLQVSVEKPWLLKGAFAKGETSSIIGAPGSGKSALVTDLAIHIAANQDWRGYKAKGKSGVVYLAFERGDLTKRRLEAYKRKHGLQGLPIAVVIVPINMMEPASVVVLIATIWAVAARYDVDVGLLIIDTFAKAIAYGNGDENSAKDQNRLRGHLRDVQRETGVHIGLVGHTGKDASRGERGSNAGLGDVDVEIQIAGDKVKTATVTKANDQQEGLVTTFALESFEFGHDEDGDPITVGLMSAEVPNEQPTNRPNNTRLNHGETVALKALRNALADGGERPPASNYIPEGVRVLKKDLWRRYAYLAGISAEDTSEDAKRMAFKRALEGLQRKELISVWEPYVWVTSE